MGGVWLAGWLRFFRPQALHEYDEFIV
jgi:hypothetical protein